MPALEWSDALSLDLPMMDTTHQEFVELLAVVEAASDADLLPAWQQLVDHTDDHFGREDRWMTDTRFASSNCHSTQHHVVLQIMQDGAAKARTAPWCGKWPGNWPSGSRSTRRPWMPLWPCTCGAWATTHSPVSCTPRSPCPARKSRAVVASPAPTPKKRPQPPEPQACKPTRPSSATARTKTCRH